MARKNRQELKNHFKNGLKPDENAFADVIDSSINFTDDSITVKNGMVGVNTTDPVTTLHVNDTILGKKILPKKKAPFLVGNHQGYNLTLNGSTVKANNGLGTSNLHVQPNGGDIYFYAANTDGQQIVMNDGGRMGIGTDKAYASLHIIPEGIADAFSPKEDAEEDKLSEEEKKMALKKLEMEHEEEKMTEEEFDEKGFKVESPDIEPQVPGIVIGYVNGLNLSFSVNGISARRGLKPGILRLNPLGGNISHAGSIIHDSDKRLKENIEPLNKGLKEVLKLNPVSYKWKKETGNEQDLKYGFLAQDVEKILKDIAYSNPDTGIKGISSIELIPVLVKSIQEQNTKILDLEARMSKLEKLVQKK